LIIQIKPSAGFYRFKQGANASFELKTGQARALNFKTLKKSLNVEEVDKALKSLEFSSRANQTSDGSGLEVDGPRLVTGW